MKRSALLLVALLSCCPAAHAATQAMRRHAALDPAAHSQRMAVLKPTLRQWVVDEGRRSADSGPDVAAIGEAVRTRLAGQDFTTADTQLLVQLVMAECARDAEADLRAVAAEMQANLKEKKRGRKPMQVEEDVSRPDPAPVEAAPARAVEADTDSLSDLSEEQQLRLQRYQDRRERAMELLSNLMKKQSETASGITSNLK